MILLKSQHPHPSEDEGAEPYSYCACRLKIAASSVVAQFVQDHIEQVTELRR